MESKAELFLWLNSVSFTIQYPPGDESILHLWKRKNIDSKVPRDGTPENRPSEKETIVFQPSIFGCENVSFREGSYQEGIVHHSATNISNE